MIFFSLALLYFTQYALGFIDCPTAGYKLCNTSEVAYLMTGISNISVSNCVYENCPQIVITESFNISFRNVTFTHRNSGIISDPSGFGGALLIQGSSSVVTLVDVLFDHVAFVSSGSAIFVYNSTAVLNNCTFVGNQALRLGGAVMIYKAQAFNCTRCKFLSNRAPNGGAVSIINDNDATLSPAYFVDCLFDGNQAENINRLGQGGSIFLQDGGSLILLASRIVNGYAGVGAGIFMNGECSALVQDCFGSNLEADEAAFLFSYGSSGYNTLHVKNCIFKGLKARKAGVFFFDSGATYAMIEGSVFIESNAGTISSIGGENLDVHIPINVFNCSFYDDFSNGGGAIYVVSLNLNHCKFCNSYTSKGGSAVTVDDENNVNKITNSQFYACTNNFFAGAVYINSGDTLIDNCYFERCSSMDGGAVYVGDVRTIKITRSTFVNNSAETGGDISMEGAPSGFVSISHCFFYNSFATHCGSLSSFMPLTLFNNTFQNTRSVQYGGAISAEDVAVSIIGCTFINSTAGRGGAVSLFSVTLNMEGVNFTSCSSMRWGGVLYLYDMRESNIANVISSNSTSISGGFLTTRYCDRINLLNVLVQSTESADRGGIIYSEISTLVLESCQFLGPKSSSGGAIYLTYTSMLYAHNLSISGCEAIFGGAFYLDGTSTGSCDGCTFLDIVSNSNGTLVYAIQETSFSLTASTYQNEIPETLTGSLFYLQSAQLFVQNFTLEYGSSLTGTLVNAIQASSCNFNALTLKYVTATEQEGSIVIADDASILQFTSCDFVHPKAEKLFLATGSSQITFTSTRLLFDTQPTVNLPVWSRQMNQVLFEVNSDSFILFYGSSQVIGFTGEGVFIVNSLGIIGCQNSVIIGSVTKYAPIYGLTDSSVTLSSCKINSNTVYGAIDTCSLTSGVIGLGGAVASTGNVLVTGSSEFLNNVADYGGAIFISDPGTLSIGNGTIIWNNTASTFGGAFYIDTLGLCEMKENVTVSNNTAVSYPSSSFALFKSGFLQFTYPDSSFESEILVLNHSTAEAFSNNTLVSSSLIKLEGRAKVLTLVNYKNGSTIELAINAEIPSIELGALDGFNRLAMVYPAKLVIITAEEVARGASLKGETIKNILDPLTRTTTMNTLNIPNRTPGYYTLKFSANPGSLDNSDLPDMPLILNIHYHLCNPTTELYVPSENDCIPLVTIKSYIRMEITVICSVLIFGCLVTLYGLYIYREYNLVKANSYVFLSIPVFGCILAFLAPILASVSCILSTAFENVGFCLIFASLVIKLYRIRILFMGNLIVNRGIVKYLRESYLILYLIMAVALVLLYELFWGIFQNPNPIPTFIPTLRVVITDKCNMESYPSYGMAALKFTVSIFVSYLAFVNRKAPSEFNEARYIGYSCYNWVIFGTFIGLMSQYLITSPDISFVAKSLSLIFSHACTTLYLATYKVYKCWRDGNVKKPVFQKTDVSSGDISNIDGLKSKSEFLSNSKIRALEGIGRTTESTPSSAKESVS